MKIKRIIAGISAICLMGAVLPYIEGNSGNVSITVNASDEAGDINGTYEVLTYIKFEDHIYISGCDKLATKVVIPAKIEGLPVTSIGNAFYKCSALTSVVIPDSVTFIGDSAFAECSSLTSVEIPESVESIGRGAFSLTPWLEEKREENPFVIINGILIDAMTYSGDEAVIPDNVTNIGDFAFYGCSALKSVIIPDSVEDIGMCAFYGCSGLTSITISDGVATIGGSAFEGCESLTSIEIPDSVTLITEGAFTGCNSLKSIKILNPECFIHDSGYLEYERTIGNTITIYGYDNSTAQKYAENFGNEFVSLGEAPTKDEELEVTLMGDANCDEHLTIADATAIIQYLGNPDEYELSEQGKINADCYNPGDGITGKDASAIQMIESGLINSLPE